MLILICELLIIGLIYIEYRRYKIAATPLIILSGIYVLLIPVINTVGVYLGFYKLEDKTILCFTIYILLVFLSGQFVNLVYKNRNYMNIELWTSDFNNMERTMWRIYLVGLTGYVISLIQVINIYGIDNTKSNAFGIFAHIGFISRCLFPLVLYYAIKKRKIKYFIAIAINILAMIAFKGKYHLYIAVAGFVVFFLITKRDINVLKLAKIVVIVFWAAILLFVSMYTIIPNILAGDTSFNSMFLGIQFSIRHFVHYIFCPFIAANGYFDKPCAMGIENGLRIVFNPFDRLFQWSTGNGDYYDPAIKWWPVIDIYGNTGNVGGIFAETVYNIGYLGTTIYIIVISIIVYHFLNKALFLGKRRITAIYLVGMLMVCFFCNYFSLLPNLECFVICYLVDVFILDNTLKIGEYVLFKRRKSN